MKRYLLTVAALAACLLVAAPRPQAVNADGFAAGCKAAYACDFASGTPVYEKECEKRLPIASMCKIMTLLLSFEAADAGEIAYNEQIVAGENAAGMGGSQVFLGAGLSYTCEQLMKSVAVCSANDSCVALAERIAGSESAFVERMNGRAKELGAENTLFANCTGLPKEPQYSCAKDVALMLRELLKHEKYFEFSRVWLEDFAHPDGRTTSMTNTNKLIRSYEGCDGGKTGFTNEAGFCLAATAKRGETRLISVAIGADSSKSRFKAVSELFSYGFSAYESVRYLEGGEPLGCSVNVRGSRIKQIPLAARESLSAFGKRGEKDCTVELCPEEEVKAPVKKGDVCGYAALCKDGVEIARTELVALEDAARSSWWDAFREAAQNWN